MKNSYAQSLENLQANVSEPIFSQITRGIEREALRIDKQGKLSQKGHYPALGSALAHDYITTDYAESLLEFITPATSDAKKTIQQLNDIHRFVLRNIGDEILWPNSMPCYVGKESDIALADYGTSNVGKMKTLYREGLRNRYGSIMQVISGVHFNLSLPSSFWDWFQTYKSDSQPKQDFISERYFALTRNYKRFCWVIPYLYGASPALCSSFVEHAETNLPFKLANNGNYYLPYATSLRMSDLGYTNSSQSDLKITYNSLKEYCQGLWRAISTPSPDYERIGVKVDGEFKQLNSNILQIENEFYSAIRPKRVTYSLEKPTQALCRRGVEYIEVRALDVNPFEPAGVSLQQVYFLDVFLAYCALLDSPDMSVEQQLVTEGNINSVVLEGRDPELELDNDGTKVNIRTWLAGIFDDLAALAKVMSELSDVDYSAVVELEREKVVDADKTFSGLYLADLLKADPGFSPGLVRAESYAKAFKDEAYEAIPEAEFNQQAQSSIAKQLEIEQADVIGFEQFLDEYFAEDGSCS